MLYLLLRGWRSSCTTQKAQLLEIFVTHRLCHPQPLCLLCLLRASCHCTILFHTPHNRLVQYSEPKLCLRLDTDFIAPSYSPEWGKETRCRLMDSHNQRLLSCHYTAVKWLSIVHIAQYNLWQEMWYRSSSNWLRNRFTWESSLLKPFS